MKFFGFDIALKKSGIVDMTNDNPYDKTTVTSLGNITVPEKLTDLNCFTLANTVSEINFPIDFYADRISKLRFYIADKNNKELEVTELNRFLTDINPFYTFSDLVYQYVLSYLSTGNAYTYLKTPSIYGRASVNSISRLDILHPDKVAIYENLRVSLLNVSNLSEVIQRIQYTDSIGLENLRIENFKIDNFSINKRDNSVILSKSPLFVANKSIDTLLSVYSARYNVYANNGYAGYLTAKQNTVTPTDIVQGTNNRDKILADINSRAGVTGKRNLWGISGVPLEFVNTLCTIKDLMPFDETLEDSIKIASPFQIPAGLVPRKDQSTYNNQAEDERKVWENGILNLVNTVCQNFTRNLTIDKAGYKILADTSSVSCLKANEATIEELNTKKLANLDKIKTMYPEKATEVNAEIDKILLQYGNR